MAVLISGSATTGHRLLGNYVGTSVAGSDLGGAAGIVIDGASGNVVGGTGNGEGNVIAFHNTAGVDITAGSGAGTGNSLRGNSLFQNDALGIDLGSDGLTANDPGDADDGPNNLQNFPNVTSAAADDAAGEITVAYRVDSDPANASYPIAMDFYLSDEREGRVYLGTDSYSEADFTSGADKIATFAPAAPVAAEDSLVATATDAAGNTSEFSGAMAVSGAVADTTPPVCGPIEVERVDGTLAAVSTSASDSESGIASVAFTTLENLEGFLQGTGGFAQGDAESFDPAATEMVTIRGERLDFSRGGAILTTVANGAGLTAQCDPVVEQISAELPQAFALKGSYPNPFRTETRIGFSLAEPAEVTLEVFDMLGRKVATLARGEEMAARHYEVTWDGRDASGRQLAPGVYLYRIRASTFTGTGRTVLVR